MKALQTVICAALILVLTGVSSGQELRLIISADEQGAQTADGFARFLKNKGLPLDQVSPAGLNKSAPAIALFGSSKPGGPLAALMAEALKSNLAATQSDTYGGLMVVQDVWAKNQAVLLFVGHTPEAVKSAVAYNKETWSSVLGDLFNLELSIQPLYGY
jgi:hypothetical protein